MKFYHEKIVTFSFDINVRFPVVDANPVNAFKARLDKFWLHHEVMFDFTA